MKKIIYYILAFAMFSACTNDGKQSQSSDIESSPLSSSDSKENVIIKKDDKFENITFDPYYNGIAVSFDYTKYVPDTTIEELYYLSSDTSHHTYFRTTIDVKEIKGRDSIFLNYPMMDYHTLLQPFSQTDTNIPVFLDIMKDLEHCIETHVSNLNTPILSMYSFDNKNHFLAYYIHNIDGFEVKNIDLFDYDLDLNELIHQASIGNKHAWDKLDRIAWDQCKLTSEVTDNRIQVLGWKYPDNIIFQIRKSDGHSISHLIHVIDFINCVPLSYNLLESFLRRISDGNLSLLNIHNDSVAQQFLIRHYVKILNDMNMKDTELSFFCPLEQNYRQSFIMDTQKDNIQKQLDTYKKTGQPLHNK